MKRFLSYIEEIRKQKKLTKTQVYLAAFGILLFLSLALTLPNYLLKHQQILKSKAQTVSDCTGVTLSPGADIQAAVNANPNGTTFCLQQGVFRLGAGKWIIPKAGDTFKGAGRGITIINGSKVLNSGWVHSGNYWYITGQTQQNFFLSGAESCPPGNPVACRCYDANYPRCVYPEEMFFDNVRKNLAGVHDANYNDPLTVIGPGKWYFDYTTDTIYVGDDPTGHNVETSVAYGAFVGGSATDNVTIQDMTIEKTATSAQWGAISPINQ